MAMLQRYADEMNDQICRFCTTCEAACPQQVAVAVRLVDVLEADLRHQ